MLFVSTVKLGFRKLIINLICEHYIDGYNYLLLDKLLNDFVSEFLVLQSRMAQD